MKKFIFMLSCAAMLILGGCGKDNSKGDETVIDPVIRTWASLVKAYPFLGEFPEFKGEIENCQYREGSEIYRKKKDNTTYIFTGSYSGGNLALSFSADSDN